MEKNSESDINHSAGERWKSSLQLMRIPFSVFLMPVFWFALIPVDLNWGKAILVFITLHLFVYPSSNGYNSYFDRDEKSIGGIKHPPKVTGELWYLILIFDFFSLLLATSVSLIFAAMIFVYILVSKAYSWDKVRLKKYPITGAAVVSVFQGAFTFMAVQIAVSDSMLFDRDDLILALVSSLFLLGSYPLTQIYQHEEDSKRGDKSLSMLLGIKGTFIFSAIAFAVQVQIHKS